MHIFSSIQSLKSWLSIVNKMLVCNVCLQYITMCEVLDLLKWFSRRCDRGPSNISYSNVQLLTFEFSPVATIGSGTDCHGRVQVSHAAITFPQHVLSDQVANLQADETKLVPIDLFFTWLFQTLFKYRHSSGLNQSPVIPVGIRKGKKRLFWTERETAIQQNVK